MAHAVAVVDEGGFTAAADAVGVTQPALSQSVAALERSLGVALFHRRGRQVRLTPAGEAFLGPARQVLRSAEAARQATEAVADVRAGRLDLVAIPTLAVDPLAELVGAFRSAHPGVVVRITAPDARRIVLDEVARGDAELGLADLGEDRAGLVARPVAEQELLLVSPPGTRSRPRVAREVLGRLDLVSTPPGTSTRRLLEDACASAGVTARVAVETVHREALAPFVLAGAGAALLAWPQAREAAARGATVARLDPPLRRQVGFLHRDGPLSPAATAFLAVADQALGATG